MESRGSWGAEVAQNTFPWPHSPSAEASPPPDLVALKSHLSQNSWWKKVSFWRLILWHLWKDQLLGDSLSDFLKQSNIKGQKYYVWQEWQQWCQAASTAGGFEVLQHHMLSATKSLQQERKPKTEHNKNVDKIVSLHVLSCPSSTEAWKGQKRHHSAAVSTCFSC